MEKTLLKREISKKGLRRKLKQRMPEYKTLEQQLTELYKSRKLRIETIGVRPLKNNKFEWKIIAEPLDKDADKEVLKEISRKK